MRTRPRLAYCSEERAVEMPPCDAAYVDYCAAHARWHATKSNAAGLAVRDAYNRWATAFLGEANSERVKALAAKVWKAA